MDAINTISPLVGVAMGSLLTGAGALYKARKERQRLIAGTLADLLEVRHRIVSADVAIRMIGERMELQPGLVSGFRDVLEHLLPSDASLHERYDKAVTTLASIDPILAFTLRSKNSFPLLFSNLRALAASNGVDRASVERLETELRLATTPALDDAVIELASAHSWHTKRKVQRLIKRSATAPAPLTHLLHGLERAPSSIPTAN